MIPKEDMLRDIEISYEYLDTSDINEEKLTDMKLVFANTFRNLISENWNYMLSKTAYLWLLTAWFDTYLFELLLWLCFQKELEFVQWQVFDKYILGKSFVEINFKGM